ncbi:MAG: phosphoribosylformimino-5-aminoimidazole carboxamide ribotide isomerase [Candidatus Sumerlaeota bacterium]
MFRPCIDLHGGKVKQIVGGSLRDDETPETNFETDRSPSWYADLYRRDKLSGGHVIMLGPGNASAAREALMAWPGGLQVGGGINLDNSREWLSAGASHVIVTSYVFHDGKVDWPRLEKLAENVTPERLVLDLSCRKREGRYYVVTDRWQKFTDVELTAKSLIDLSRYCEEFLVHAADVEGKQSGIDEDIVSLLAAHSPITTTYAGGIRNIEDLETIERVGRGRLCATVGSALDIFGGPLSYEEVVRRFRPGASCSS